MTTNRSRALGIKVDLERDTGKGYNLNRTIEEVAEDVHEALGKQHREARVVAVQRVRFPDDDDSELNLLVVLDYP
jgi:hypothetical protein